MLNILSIDFSSEKAAKLDDFKNIDNIKNNVKALILIGSPVLLFALFFYLAILPISDDIGSTTKNIEQEQSKYDKNKRLASNIKRKRVEYKELQKDLAVALNMLPKRSQIPDLLDNVSKAGVITGLKFLRFSPMPERNRSIHTEVPSKFKAVATFEQLMQFLDNTGSLPRIVDVKNLEIKRIDGDPKRLNIKGNILTYRFTDSGVKKGHAKKHKNK